MGFVRCLLYLGMIGLVSMPLSRLVPEQWTLPDRGPYKPVAFEERLYKRLNVHKWQKKIPDVSRFVPKLVPRKQLVERDGEHLSQMIRETCLAELIHVLLGIAGLGCLRIWKGLGGAIVTLLYMIGNLPFIVVQRYNRPRLLRLKARLDARRKESALE